MRSTLTSVLVDDQDKALRFYTEVLGFVKKRRDGALPWNLAPGNEALMAGHAFDTVMAALDSPLIVVTTADQRERAGCLVEFHVQSSIEPRRYCVWLSKANYTYRVALQSSHLVIHFLTGDDLPLAELFGTQTGDTVDKFAALLVDSGPGGAPVLRQCPQLAGRTAHRAA